MTRQRTTSIPSARTRSRFGANGTPLISVTTGMIKISVFGLSGVVTAQVLALAVLIGAIALPGAFLAKVFVERMPVHIHTAILDVAVIVGGVVMISAAARHLW